MSKQSQGSMAIIGAIAGGVFLVAIVALMTLGNYTFSPALFLALAVAVAVAVFLLFAFHRSPRVEMPSRLTARVPAARSARAAASPEPRKVDEAPAAAAMSAPPAAPAHGETTPEPAAAPDEPAPVAAADATVGTEPMRLEQPREGRADDLKKIKGVGPKLEEALNRMGIYHLDQIASWNEAEVAWMDENLVDFRGRVSRDDWVGQARHLASGGETEFSRRVDDGEVYH